MSPHTAPDRYAPDREILPHGVIVETYGNAHAARQADALALLDEISWADSAITTTVRCACKEFTRLAVVYRTVPPVVVIVPETHPDRQLKVVQAQLAPPPLSRDMRIEYGEDVVADILTATDDRDLYARCRQCGRYELDRAQLIDGFDTRQSDIRAHRR